jgi:outer membrane protein assembly factor BamB
MLALTPSSQLIAFAPDGKAYKELARLKVADSPTYAYPVVSGNRIFVKDQNSVTLWTVQ